MLVVRPIKGHLAGDVIEVAPSRQVRALIEQGKLLPAPADATPTAEADSDEALGEAPRRRGRPKKIVDEPEALTVDLPTEG